MLRLLKKRQNYSQRFIRDLSKMQKARTRVVKLFYENVLFRRYGCCISPYARIADSVAFPHPSGIVVGSGVVIEENCTIYQHVTIGRASKEEPYYPVIEKNCTIYSGAVIVGGIRLKEGTIVGANAVVTKGPLSANETLVGIPARSKRKAH